MFEKYTFNNFWPSKMPFCRNRTGCLQKEQAVNSTILRWQFTTQTQHNCITRNVQTFRNRSNLRSDILWLLIITEANYYAADITVFTWSNSWFPIATTKRQKGSRCVLEQQKLWSILSLLFSAQTQSMNTAKEQCKYPCKTVMLRNNKCN